LPSRVSSAGALTAIGLIAFAIHWGLAQRSLRRDESGVERRSKIRKLYLYAFLLVGGVMATFAFRGLIDDAYVLTIGRLSRGQVLTGRLAEPAGMLVAFAVLWLYHARIAAFDRALEPEIGAGATLRRWWVYVLTFVALMLFLIGADGMISTLWESLVAPVGTVAVDDGWLISAIGGPAASTAAGLVVWFTAWRWSTGWLTRAPANDAEPRSVLRKVYLYAVLAVAVGWSVWDAGRILYEILQGLLLGSRRTGGWPSVWHDLGAPTAALVVFGLAWAYHARVVGREARLAPERQLQATIRWLYAYLVALVGVVTLAFGLGGALSTVLDLLVQPGAERPTNWWENRVSLFATLVVVGLPLWLAYWTPLQREAAEAMMRQSLVRRIYLLLAVALSVLTLLGSGAFTVYQVMRATLGERWTAGQTTQLTIAASAAAVAALFLVYHFRALRADSAAHELAEAGVPVVGLALVRAPNHDAWQAAVRQLSRPPHGVRVELWEIDEARAAEVEASRPAGDG
jgi:hypothetical protein